MTHEHLVLESGEGLNCNTNNDDDGGTAEGDAGICSCVAEVADNDRSYCNNAQEDGAEQSDLVQDLLDELAGGLAGTIAGDKATVALQVICYSMGLNWMVE